MSSEHIDREIEVLRQLQDELRHTIARVETVLNTLYSAEQAASQNADSAKLEYFFGYEQAISDVARLMGIELEIAKRYREKAERGE